MTLYDEVLKQIQTLINPYPQTAYSYNPSELWPDAGRNNFVLASDMAYELGGSTKQLKALGSTVITYCFPCNNDALTTVRIHLRTEIVLSQFGRAQCTISYRADKCLFSEAIFCT